MSRINKLKQAMSVMDTNDFPSPIANQQFARVIKSHGNNLHEVEPAEPIAVSAPEDGRSPTPPPAHTFLVSMPLRFRKSVYVLRGTFVIIEMITDRYKVKAEIARVLLPEHVRQFREDGIWPAKFEDEQPQQKQPEPLVKKTRSSDRGNSDGDSDDESDDDSDLEENTNGWHGSAESSDEEEEDEDEEIE